MHACSCHTLPIHAFLTHDVEDLSTTSKCACTMGTPKPGGGWGWSLHGRNPAASTLPVTSAPISACLRFWCFINRTWHLHFVKWHYWLVYIQLVLLGRACKKRRKRKLLSQAKLWSLTRLQCRHRTPPVPRNEDSVPRCRALATLRLVN